MRRLTIHFREIPLRDGKCAFHKQRAKKRVAEREAGLQVSGLRLTYRPLEVNICAMKTLAKRSVTAYIRGNGDCRHANGE